MNIKEMLDWRRNCFFCEGGLSYFPLHTKFRFTLSTRDDWMDFRSRLIQFSIHMINGTIINVPEQEKEIDGLLTYNSLEVVLSCSNCYHTGMYYGYKSKISLLSSHDRMSMVLVPEETVVGNKYVLTQYWNKGFSKIDIKNNMNPKVSDQSYPLIDLKNINSEQLEHKLKIYVVFS